MPKATHNERSQAAQERRRTNGHEPYERDDGETMAMPFESYMTVMREFDHLNRLWYGSMRQTMEAGYTLAHQLSQAMIEDTWRMSERWLSLYDRDRQAMTAFGQDMAGRAERMGQHLERTHVQATEHRQAAE
jgi:hypothetical protein